ncbi:MAG: hypothetical protein VW498_02185 [Candidatus Thalassarchaeaceae archaeon]
MTKPTVGNSSYERHCLWILKAIRQHDDQYTTETDPAKRAAMRMDLLSSIKFTTEMELGLIDIGGKE